jgi:glutaredoxin
MRKAILLLGLAAMLAAPAYAQMYKWVDAQGVTHYSDRPPPVGDAEKLDLDARAQSSGLSADGGSLYQPPEPDPKQQARRTPDILMYTDPKCGACIKADRYFASKGVPVRRIDVTASARNLKEFHDRGGRGTPMFLVNGERFSGFSSSRFNRILREHGWQ